MQSAPDFFCGSSRSWGYGATFECFPQFIRARPGINIEAIGCEARIARADNTYGYGLVNVLGAYNLYATASAIISALPSSYGFGFAAVGTSSAVQTFIVTNKGVAANLSISSVSITGTDGAQFSKQSGSCSGQTIAPLAACTISLQLLLDQKAETFRSHRMIRPRLC